MKRKRQGKILEIIAHDSVNTQDDLMKKLKGYGFEVTQATVSRDMRELRLVKVSDEKGGYKYSAPEEEEGGMAGKYRTILKQSVKSAEAAMNIVAVKCYTGMANAACAAIDALHASGVVGTLAGDDTIFVLLKTEKLAQEFTESFRKYYD